MKLKYHLLQNIHFERFIWCLAVAGFCWADSADYHHMMNNKDLLIWCVLGFYYAYRLGACKKENRWLSLGCLLIGSCIAIYFIKSYFFLMHVSYMYYDYTMGLLSIVLLLQYSLLFKNYIKQKIFPRFSYPAIFTILIFLLMQFSPHEEKTQYAVFLLILLPYACMNLSKQRQKDILVGMVDGLCLGFFICQIYTFMFRPYFYTETGVRFKAFRTYCTYAGVSYLQFFIGCLLRYAIWFKENRRPILRKVFFFLSTFAIALLYLTGGRGPFLGVMAVTALVIAVISWNKHDIRSIGVWLGKSIAIGLISVLLFPVAYAGTRYIPAIVNHPDLQDLSYNRMYSFASMYLEQEPNTKHPEFSVFGIKKDDPVDSVKYISFVESLEGTLGRIVPGLDSFVKKYMGEALLENRFAREYFFVENGAETYGEFCNNILDYCWIINQKIPEEYVELITSIIPGTWMETYYTITETGHVVRTQDIQTPEQTDAAIDVAAPTLSLFHDFGLITVKAADGEEVPEPILQRGDSPETGWFPDYNYSSMDLRFAMHAYTLSKLNLTGHEKGTFKMYYVMGSDSSYPHAHNMFLQTGYDYGAPAMIMMIAMFVSMIIVCMRQCIKYGKTEYLLPVALIVGLSIHGMFEVAFNCRDSYPLLIMLLSMLIRHNDMDAESVEESAVAGLTD